MAPMAMLLLLLLALLASSVRAVIFPSQSCQLSAQCSISVCSAPCLRCPESLTVEVPVAVPTRVHYLTPHGSSCCYTSTSLQSGLASGSYFPVGVTNVSYTASDPFSGRSSTCWFTVTITTTLVDPYTKFLDSTTADLDGDGFTTADGDCCELPWQCPDPYLVNPGAWEIPGNGVDDNCNGIIDDANDHCSPCSEYQQTVNSDRLLEVGVRAMGVCERVDDDDDKSWGYFFTPPYHPRLNLADGVLDTSPNAVQSGVYGKFGRQFARDGSMFVLSTGSARMPNCQGHLNVDNETIGNPSPPPQRWIDRNGGLLPFPSACQQPSSLSQQVFDSARLRVWMRQPTNARGYSVDVLFMSQQPPNANVELTPGAHSLSRLQGVYPPPNPCAQEKDFFLLLSGADGAPPDQNVAIDGTGQAFTTLNQNPDFWRHCIGAIAGSANCRRGPFGLINSGYDGSSEWISVGSSALPGERYTLDFVLFEALSGRYDSTVLLDNFQLVQEARTDSSYGVQRQSDLQITSLLAPNELVSAGLARFELAYELTTFGPEAAGDLYITFTPPQNVTYVSSTYMGKQQTCNVIPANSVNPSALRRCRLQRLAVGTEPPMLPGETRYGSIQLQVASGVVEDIKLRLTASCSSVESNYANNYREVVVHVRALSTTSDSPAPHL